MRRKLDEYLEDSKRGLDKSKGTETTQDIEQIATLVAEKTVAILTKGLIKEIGEIKAKLEDIKNDIEVLKREVASLKMSTVTSRTERRSSSLKIINEIKDVLKNYGYVLAGELASEKKINPLLLRKILTQIEDLEIIEVEGDLIAINKAVLDEFRERLKTLKTTDPVEASRALGKFNKLFTKLRRGGLIIYDKKAGWRLLEI